MENVINMGKLLSLWVCFLFIFILFFKTPTSYRTDKIISKNELARPVMRNIFLVGVTIISVFVSTVSSVSTNC